MFHSQYIFGERVGDAGVQSPPFKLTETKFLEFRGFHGDSPQKQSG